MITYYHLTLCNREGEHYPFVNRTILMLGTGTPVPTWAVF